MRPYCQGKGKCNDPPDARPTAGTQEMPKDWVKLIEERMDTITPYVGKKYDWPKGA